MRLGTVFALYEQEQKKKRDAVRRAERQREYRNKQSQRIIDKIAEDKNLDSNFSDILKGL